MAKFWFKRILAGKATIDDVPERWRESVQAYLDAGAKKGEDDSQ